MSSPSATDQSATNASAKTAHQAFQYREVPRSKIKTAAYNPRILTESARRLLKRQIEKNKLVETLVWNERGNLVSGHARLSILDQLQKYEPAILACPSCGTTPVSDCSLCAGAFEPLPVKNDYLVGVAVVRLSERQEKSLNVFMNNAAAQGNFSEGLLQMVAEGLDLEEVGMGQDDLAAMFPGMAAAQAPATASSAPAVPVEAPKVAQSESAAIQTPAAPKAETDAVMVVWPTRAARDEYLASIGLDVNGRFYSSREFFGG